MKSNYIKPEAECIALQTEGMMAASSDPGNKYQEQGQGAWHAPKRDGWDSSAWSQPADADDEQ